MRNNALFKQYKSLYSSITFDNANQEALRLIDSFLLGDQSSEGRPCPPHKAVGVGAANAKTGSWTRKQPQKNDEHHNADQGEGENKCPNVVLGE